MQNFWRERKVKHIIEIYRRINLILHSAVLNSPSLYALLFRSHEDDEDRCWSRERKWREQQRSKEAKKMKYKTVRRTGESMGKGKNGNGRYQIAGGGTNKLKNWIKLDPRALSWFRESAEVAIAQQIKRGPRKRAKTVILRPKLPLFHRHLLLPRALLFIFCFLFRLFALSLNNRWIRVMRPARRSVACFGGYR